MSLAKKPTIGDKFYEKTLESALEMVNIYICGGPGQNQVCQTFCYYLFKVEQPVPLDSLFRDDRLQETCKRLRYENESKVIRDITPLLVPSVEVLCAMGEEYLGLMIDHASRKWDACIPMIDIPPPQPAYSVGFKKTAFTSDQLVKLKPFIKDWESSRFLATPCMLFPFFMVEVECGNEGLHIADRRNALSAAIAVKQVVNLFRMIHLQKEMNGRMLAFSVSHNHKIVKIYCHYPVINEDDDTFIYRHLLKEFDITADNGKDKWTAHKFTRNLYYIIGSLHLAKLRLAVDDLPDPGATHNKLYLDSASLCESDGDEYSMGSVDFGDSCSSYLGSRL